MFKKPLAGVNAYRTLYRPEHPRASRSGCVLTHVLIAERALGKPLPASAHVHHVDGNKENNAPSNLVICQDAAYHKLLHARERVVKAGGNPNTQKYCSDCDSLKQLTDFNRSISNKSNGRQSICRECQRVRERKHRATRSRVPSEAA